MDGSMPIEDLLRCAAAALADRRSTPPEVDGGSRYHALREELGIGDLLVDDHHGADSAQHYSLVMAGLLVRSMAGIEDPFEGMLEAPSSIVRIYREHASVIGEAAASYERALLEAAVDALEAGHPGLRERRAGEPSND